ncbi:MAG: AMP-binding protein, partial [Acidimicrobiia bacterium]|nr:AMP-binding protein [Acidimicrobiia bacterium]
APWVRPADTGRSTNCLINAAGIHTHLTEQGYHNYAIPYAWDVRLGHKTRHEAIEELDDQLDLDEVTTMLAEVGYQPRRREVLTAWFEPASPIDDGAVPDGAELRSFLSRRLPDYAIPAAFVPVEQVPLTVNGKVDTDALPAPERVHRPSAGLHVPASTETERQIVKVWEKVLGIEPIGVDDDFFALGGDSLAALESIVALADALSVDAAEDLAFRHTTPRSLALVLDSLMTAGAADTAARGGASAGSDGPAGSTTATAPPRPEATGEVPDLSPGQQAILFDQAARPDDIMYNIGRVYRVEATAEVLRDQAALCGVLERVAERHQSLSWTYGASRRRLSGAEALSFRVADPVDEADLADTLAAVHRAPFDLDNGPLLRCLVQPVTDGPTAVLLVVHHASSDAESFDIIWREVNILLTGAELEPLPTDYGGYCRWQQERREDRDRRYWLEADVGTGNRPGFVVFEPEPDGFLQRAASVPPSALDRADGATAFAVALCAIGAALRPFCTETEVEIGLITSTRTDAAAEPLVGYFLNTVPMVIDRDAVAVARRLGETLSHRAFPLARILADRREACLPAAAPSIYVAFDDLGPGTVGSATAEQRVLSNGSAVADATIFVERRPDRLDISLEYRGSVMTEAQAKRVLTAIDAALADLTGSGPARASVASDQASRLDGPPLPEDASRPLLGRIVDLLDAAGESPAVVCGDRSLSWVDLGRRSADLARHLIAQGVDPGEPVAVTVGRSVDLVVAIVGVLRAGGAYVPIDPTYPRQRRELLLERSGARIVVDADLIEAAARSHGAAARDDAHLAALPSVGPDDPAYLIFTSGSTGEPKPVRISHGRLTASTLARRPFYGVDATGSPIEGSDTVADFRYLMVSSASFDSSVAGIFWTLAEGGTLVLPTDDEVHDVDAVADLLVDRGITHTLMVPTLYQAVMASMERRGLLRPVGDRQQWPGQVIVAGEACPSGLVEQHYRHFPLSRLTNEYGPTEATVWATGHHVRFGDDPVPIGVPIAGTWLEVRGPDGAVRPAEVAGELVIGGAGVAEQFGSTYATGDRATVVDGMVQYLGRVDNQLNLGGVRVEPEEIERVLAAVPGVQAVVVTASAGRRLAAWVAVDVGTESMGAPSDGTVPESDLRDVAAAALPPLWRPSAYRLRADLPQTANGKVDRQAVAEFEASLETEGPTGRSPMGDGAAATEAERAMVRLFAEALGHAEFGLDDSFFDHGGHSLTAIELLLAIEEEFGRRIPVSALYRSQTPRGLVAVIEAADPNDDQAVPDGLDAGAFLVPIQPNGTRVPVFAIHVLGIDCAYFRPLSARLGDDQPMYGLGQPTHDADLRTEGPTSVAGIAAEYVAEINRVRPDGPLILIAISLGGVVAFETAQQLIAAGRDVALLALFDAAGPAAVQMQAELGLKGRLATHVNALRDDPRDYVVGRAAYNLKKLRRAAELGEAELRRRFGLDPSHRLEVRRFIEDNIQSQLRYEYRPYPGPMAVYKAAEDPFTGHFLEIDLGWRPVADGGLTIRVVEGDHLTMVAEPHVGRLADLLRVDVDDALAADDRR